MRRSVIYLALLAVLIVVVFNVHAWLVLSRSRATLEDELGDRLETLARAVATQLRGRRAGPELSRILAQTMEEAGLFNIFLVDESLRFILNVREPEAVGGGGPLLELDAAEILSAFSGVSTRSRVYSTGPYYLKNAYAPVYDSTGIARAVLGVEADARFFRSLVGFRNSLVVINGFSLLVLLALILVSLTVVRQAMKIEAAAARSATFALLGEMAAALAHEIRNPLATILAAAERLKIRYGAENDRTFDYIREEIERLNRTLTNYLSIGSGRPGEMERVDLGAVVNRTLEQLGAELNRNGIRVENRLDVLPPVKGSELQLRQVFLNLILNALQAQPAGGLVRVEGEEVERAGKRWVVLRVQDHGPGIPKENLKRVFEPFFTTREKGSGLGLFVVRRIVELHHGRVEIKSGAGQGTTVEVRLPV